MSAAVRSDRDVVLPSVPLIERGPALAELGQREFDLVVIGGGITGAGIAREGALAGLSVALLEASDFASGTSSRSTKLIHGGLRYLAQAEFSLVRESALERKSVHAMAPHLAEPSWMVIPTASWLESMKFRVGVAAYERLGEVAAIDRHANWDVDDLARNEPLLRRDAFPRACAYREYLTDDARLVLATLRAAVARGAVVVNHVRADGFLRSGERVSGVCARDAFTDDVIEVRGRVVVNAAGPWAAELAEADNNPLPKGLHLSKGVHVVLDRKRLGINNPCLLQLDDGRLIFAIPRADVVYVGTTDTSWHGDACTWPDVTADDVDYLLAPLPRYFDIEPITRDEVLASWAGLRPLIAEPGKAARETSRREEIFESRAGLITIAGGKLTGFRHMASEIMARVCKRLNVDYGTDARLDVLPGGDFDGDLDALVERLLRSAQLDRTNAARLARLYGSEAADVAMLGCEPVAGSANVLRGEVVWGVCVEGAQSLEDLVYRRTRLGMFTRVDNTLLDALADHMQALLAWSDTRRAEQVTAVRARLAADRAFAQPAGSAAAQGDSAGVRSGH